MSSKTHFKPVLMELLKLRNESNVLKNSRHFIVTSRYKGENGLVFVFRVLSIC